MAAIGNHAWEHWEHWEHWGQWNPMAANENGNTTLARNADSIARNADAHACLAQKSLYRV
jgi:hypothetical protein